jgi:membrane protease YdiL (CAAX protease family)
MTWREAVARWKTLDERRPAAWWVGLGGALAGAVSLSVLELKRMAPRGPVRVALLAVLVLAIVVVGRRAFWNDRERRLRLVWRLVGFAMVSGLVGFLLSAVFGRPKGFDSSGASAAALLFPIRGLVVALVSTTLAVRLLDRRPVRELGIVPVPGFWPDFVFGLVLGAGLMTLIFAVEFLAGWVTVEGTAYVRRPGVPFVMVMAGMAVVALCVGIYEELVSRGYLLRAFAQGLAGRLISPRVALASATLISSLLFGLGHARNPNASVVSTVNIVFAGIVLALPFVLTGRLAAPIGFHITWNFFQSGVYGFPTSGFSTPASALAIAQGGPTAWTGGAFGPEAGVLGLAALLLGAALIVWRERRRTGAVTVCTALVEGPPPADEPPALPA